MSDNNGFKWGLFFSGLVNPLNAAKAFVMMLHMALIVIVVSSTVFSVLWVKRKLSGKKPPVQTLSISEMQGGFVHNSNDDNRKKFGVIAF